MLFLDMKKLLLTLFFTLFAFQVYALELLMAHNPACNVCQKFIEEVAVDYNNSEEAKTLPLIIISVYDQPEWFKEAYHENRIKRISGTPTFIVWNGRKELSRLVGYTNKENFMKRINIYISEWEMRLKKEPISLEIKY
jgi:thioredoxin-related protein